MIDADLVQINDRIQLIHTDDPYTKLRPGDLGTVDFIGKDVTGKVNQIGVKWDNKSSLMMLPGVDSFMIIAQGGEE